MRWCRLYAEFATDPKVQQMPEEMQRRLIILFCLHTNGDLPGATNEELLCAFRIKKSELLKTFQLFLQKNFIDEEWNLINWKKRQFQSDDVAARVRKYREGKKGAECNVTETLLKRKCNVLDTDTDTDTDTEKITTSARNRKQNGSMLFDFATRKWSGIEKADMEMWVAAYPSVNIQAQLAKAADWLVSNPDKKKTRYRRFLSNWFSRCQDRGGDKRKKSKWFDDEETQ